MKIVGFTVITHMTLKSDQESLKENEIDPLGCSQTILILELLQLRDIHLGSCRNNIHGVKCDLIKTILAFQVPVHWEAYCIFQINVYQISRWKISKAPPIPGIRSLYHYLLWFSFFIWQGEGVTCLFSAFKGPSFQRDPAGFCNKYYPEPHQLCSVQNWQTSDCKADKKPGPEDYHHFIFF